MQVETVGGRVLLRRSAEDKTPFVQRLARIEGQVRGLRQMFEDDRHCSEELQQINAVIAALREVALLAISQQVTAQINTMSDRSSPPSETQDLIDLLRSAFRLT